MATSPNGNADQQIDILDSDGLLQGGQWTAFVSGDVWAAGQAEFNARAQKYGASLDAAPWSANPPAGVVNSQRLTTAAAVDMWIDTWAPISAANANAPDSAGSAGSAGSSSAVVPLVLAGMVGAVGVAWWLLARRK